MRTLVTGATGNVGSYVVREARVLGLPAVAAVRNPDRVEAPAVRLDFADKATWWSALRGVEALFLVRPPAVADVRATLCPFIDMAIAEGVRSIVFLSVQGADRMEWVPHHAVEKHLARSSVPFTLLRPGFFAQNLEDAYLDDVLDDGRIYVPAGAAKVAFIDALDIGAVGARVLASPDAYRNQALTLTGPAAISFDRAAWEVASVLGRPVRYKAASIAGYAWHLRRRRKLPWTQIAVQTILHAGLRRGDAEPVTETVAEVLGRPATSFADYLRRATAEGHLSR